MVFEFYFFVFCINEIIARGDQSTITTKGSQERSSYECTELLHGLVDSSRAWKALAKHLPDFLHVKYWWKSYKSNLFASIQQSKSNLAHSCTFCSSIRPGRIGPGVGEREGIIAYKRISCSSDIKILH